MRATCATSFFFLQSTKQTMTQGSLAFDTSNGSGALTQLIATGAIDHYLTNQASFTFWKVRYNKHTNFAIENVSQPFSHHSFGNTSQLTLNRQGDLIYYMYVHVELPGIEGVSDENGNLMGGTQYPTTSSGSSACDPCRDADNAAIADYVSDGYTEASISGKEAKIANAKNRRRRQQYSEAPMVECCDDHEEDCPDNLCPELGKCWAHWTNDIGQHLIKSAQIVIGGSVVDHLYSDFLFMWEELVGKAGRRLSEMVGKRFTRTQLICDSRFMRHLWIPLPFWFTQHSGQSLSLASLQFHGVRIDITWAQLNTCIVVSAPNVGVKHVGHGTALQPSHLVCDLQTTYVYLDNVERERFATTQFEVLITQNQAAIFPVNGSSVVKCPLNFNHPVLEMMWAVRRSCQEQSNNFFNYSGIENRDPVIHARLQLNNQTRFSAPGQWFRLVQPYQHHSNIPDSYIYVYSFALHPEDPSPSGSCNMSRIDHVDLTLKLQDDICSGSKNTCHVIVFARNWNILRFRDGLAGLAFAN